MRRGDRESGWNVSVHIKDTCLPIVTPGDHCLHTFNVSLYGLLHGLHIHGTSDSPNTSPGMSMQCWWYQVLHIWHSAILSSFSSGNQQEQWRSTDWLCLTPVHLHSPATGKRVRRHCSKQLAKCCLIDLWSNLTLHGLIPLQISYTNAKARTLQSDSFHCLPMSIILTTNFDAGLNTTWLVFESFHIPTSLQPE